MAAIIEHIISALAVGNFAVWAFIRFGLIDD